MNYIYSWLYYQYFISPTTMIRAITVFAILWAAFILFASCTRASYANDVYSVWLERASYIHEVDSWRAEYNAELDKSFGIKIDVLCAAWDRNMSQCWLQMLYETGNKYTPYRGW